MVVVWEYYINLLSNAGRSTFQDPMQIFNLIILGVGGIIGIFNLHAIFASYRETKALETLSFFLSGVFLFAALIGLSMGRLSLTSWGLPNLADSLSIIAFIFSGIAIVCASIFVYQFTFPQHLVKLVSIVGIITTFSMGILIWAVIQGPPYCNLINLERVYSPEIILVIFCFYVPIINIAPLVFFYYASKVRDENRAVSNRSFWMGLGLICFAIGYINEITSVFPVVVKIPLRTFYIAFTFIIYLCFKMPDWFKRSIGWHD